MNYSKFQITLDTHSALSQVSIPVPQNDTARRLYVSLTDGGKPFYIEDGCRAVLAATKSDGKYIVNDCIIERNKTIRYEFTEQTTAAIGKIDCTMKLYDSNNELLTSPRFTIVVYESTVPEVTLSENEHTAVDRMLLDEQARVAAEAGRVAAENKRVSDEEARKQDYIAYKESVDSRVDSMGRVQVSNEEPTDEAVDLWINGENEEEIALLTNEDILQSPGNSENAVMSQHAVTKEIEALQGQFQKPIQEQVDNYLDRHPEATTTVQDGSLTEDKFTDDLKLAAIKDYVTPQMFGAKGDGVADDTDAVITALTYPNVKLDKVYKITEPIKFTNFSYEDVKKVELSGKLVLEDTHIEMFGYGLIVYGGGTIDGSSPDAMVKIGVTDETQERHTLKCTFKDLTIKSTNGAIGIQIMNFCKGIYGCYTNTFDNIYFLETSVGFDLVGDVNANNFSNIYMRSYAENVTAMFRFRSTSYNDILYASVENNFNQCFYFHGENTPMFLVTADTLTSVYRNTFTGISCEQFGQQSGLMKFEDGAMPTENIFSGVSINSYYGNFMDSYTEKVFYDRRNVMVSSQKNILPDLITSTTEARKAFTLGAGKKTFETVVDLEMPENTEFKLFDILGMSPTGAMPKSRGGFIEVTINEYRNGVPTNTNCETVVLQVKNDGLQILSQNASNTNRLTVDGYNVNYKTGNNGTGLSVSIIFTVKCVCHRGEADYLLSNIIEV